MGVPEGRRAYYRGTCCSPLEDVTQELLGRSLGMPWSSYDEQHVGGGNGWRLGRTHTVPQAAVPAVGDAVVAARAGRGGAEGALRYTVHGGPWVPPPVPLLPCPPPPPVNPPSLPPPPSRLQDWLYILDTAAPKPSVAVVVRVVLSPLEVEGVAG